MPVGNLFPGRLLLRTDDMERGGPPLRGALRLGGPETGAERRDKRVQLPTEVTTAPQIVRFVALSVVPPHLS
jgi:hypothetical protein